MTVFDYVALTILVSSVIIGVLRGLVKELLSMVSWMVAFFVANAYSAKLAPMLPAIIPGDVARTLVAFIALLIGTRILMGLVSMAMGAVVKAAGLTLVDRVLGSVFGLGRGVLIVLAVVILCGMTSIPKQAFWKDAMTSSLAESGARAIKPYLPPALAQHVKY